MDAIYYGSPLVIVPVPLAWSPSAPSRLRPRSRTRPSGPTRPRSSAAQYNFTFCGLSTSTPCSHPPLLSAFISLSSCLSLFHDVIQTVLFIRKIYRLFRERAFGATGLLCGPWSRRRRRGPSWRGAGPGCACDTVILNEHDGCAHAVMNTMVVHTQIILPGCAGWLRVHPTSAISSSGLRASPQSREDPPF